MERNLRFDIRSPIKSNTHCKPKKSIKSENIKAAEELLADLQDSPVKENGSTFNNRQISSFSGKLDDEDIIGLLIDSDDENSDHSNDNKIIKVTKSKSVNSKKQIKYSGDQLNLSKEDTLNDLLSDEVDTPKKLHFDNVGKWTVTLSPPYKSPKCNSVSKPLTDKYVSTTTENKARRSLALQLDSTQLTSSVKSPVRLKLKRKALDAVEDEPVCKERRTESPGYSPMNENFKPRGLRCREQIKLPKWRVHDIDDEVSPVWSSAKKTSNKNSPSTPKVKQSRCSTSLETPKESKCITDSNSTNNKVKNSLSSSKKVITSPNAIESAKEIFDILSSPKNKSYDTNNISRGSPSVSKRLSVKQLLGDNISPNKVEENLTVDEPIEEHSKTNKRRASLVSSKSNSLNSIKASSPASIRRSNRYTKVECDDSESDSDTIKTSRHSIKKIGSPMTVLRKVTDNVCSSETPVKSRSRTKRGELENFSKYEQDSSSDSGVETGKDSQMSRCSISNTQSPVAVSKQKRDTLQSSGTPVKIKNNTVKHKSSPVPVKNTNNADGTHKNVFNSRICLENIQPKSTKHARNRLVDSLDGALHTSDSLEKARIQLLASTIPISLPCRDKEFSNIYNFIARKIEDVAGGCMYISGVPGTGKTATVHAVIRKFQLEVKEEEVPEFDFVEINGLRLTEPRQAYTRMWQTLTGNRLTTEQAQRCLDRKFSSNSKKPTVLLVDELDYLCNKRQDVVYNILDWPTRQGSGLVILTIANTMDLPERTLKGKVTSRMGLTRLVFQPYTHHQLQEIVMNRLSGSKSFHPDAIQLVARKVAAVSGDARRALDICRRATELVGSSGVVTIQNVEQALSQIFTGPRIRAIKSCSIISQFVLRALRDETLRTGVDESNVGAVYQHLLNICALEGVEKPTVGDILSITTTLENLGLIVAEKGRPDLVRKLSLNVSSDDIHYAINC